MKRGTIEHPKTEALARALGCGMAAAVGHLEALWHFTAKYALPGDIGRFDDATIAKKALWEGKPDEFVDALVRCGWLDRDSACRLLVHDWEDHADQAVHKTLTNRGDHFRKRSGNVPETFRQGGGTIPPCLALPSHALPVPEPIQASAKEPPLPPAEPGGEPTVTKTKTRQRKTHEPPESVPIPAALDTPEFREAWGEWIADRAERGKRMTALAARKQLAKLEAWGGPRAIAAISASIAAGWQGIFEATPNASPRGYAKRLDPPAPVPPRYKPFDDEPDTPPEDRSKRLKELKAALVAGHVNGAANTEK